MKICHVAGNIKQHNGVNSFFVYSTQGIGFYLCSLDNPLIKGDNSFMADFLCYSFMYEGHCLWKAFSANFE